MQMSQFCMSDQPLTCHFCLPGPQLLTCHFCLPGLQLFTSVHQPDSFQVWTLLPIGTNQAWI
ncbi:hypothetical protein LDENG_00182020 [Lucifuga dentata]|nr:hypothetical protein LDENG_00182020 [Lucifuga dentata]